MSNSRTDRFGLEILATEYGHVADAERFFERVAGNDLGLGDTVAYLSTHPAHADRVDEIRSHAAERPWPLEGTTVRWPATRGESVPDDGAL